MRKFIVWFICIILALITICDIVMLNRQLYKLKTQLIEETLNNKQYNTELRNEIKNLRNEFQNNEMEQSAAFSKAIKELKDKQ